MRSIALGLSGLALALVVAACGSANAVDPSASVDPSAVHVQAKGLQFATTQVEATAGRAFTIAFDNSGGSAPHNVDIVDGSGKSVYQGAIVDPGKSAAYSVPALAAGSYSFKCDLHPDMKGTIVVR
ncbi:MAG TPA: cupredoxin domain-containing protein [Candidatus Dormibacteraeota bacterium]|nr:cupredoxin domain-containing protein [Candidatus Dormibacteraeota bacterium]